jgi:hypothetical protein
MFDLKKAIISAIVYYAILFLVISALMFGPLKLGTAQTYVNWIIDVVLIYLIGTYYYFTKKPSNYLKDGLMFGIVVSIITGLIEIPVMVYGFAADQGWAWLMTPEMLVSFILTLIAAVLTAKLKK